MAVVTQTLARATATICRLKSIPPKMRDESWLKTIGAARRDFDAVCIDLKDQERIDTLPLLINLKELNILVVTIERVATAAKIELAKLNTSTGVMEFPTVPAPFQDLQTLYKHSLEARDLAAGISF